MFNWHKCFAPSSTAWVTQQRVASRPGLHHPRDPCLDKPRFRLPLADQLPMTDLKQQEDGYGWLQWQMMELTKLTNGYMILGWLINVNNGNYAFTMVRQERWTVHTSQWCLKCSCSKESNDELHMIGHSRIRNPRTWSHVCLIICMMIFDLHWCCATPMAPTQHSAVCKSPSFDRYWLVRR